LLKIYKEVIKVAKWPKMISTKDIAYIKDMFNWNNTMIRKLNEYVSVCEDETLRKYLNSALDLLNNNVNKLIKLLESGVK
jgi:hypothetical protein